MILSDKLKRLQQEFRFDELADKMSIEDGFNRCIEDALMLEALIKEERERREAAESVLNYIVPANVTIPPSLDEFKNRVEKWKSFSELQYEK